MNPGEIYNLKRQNLKEDQAEHINEYEKIKRLDYLIINTNQEGDGSYVLTQKIIKLKK